MKRISSAFNVENIVASANLQVELDLFTIAMEVDNVEYEPEQFPGAIMRLKELGTTLLLFKNGKVICSGAKSEPQIEKSIKKAISILTPYIKEPSKESMAEASVKSKPKKKR
ncbi:TATA-box-binding protein [uncultured archaeon]|nr:TATA-box-binding protein [uncultured archaeon]